MSTKAGLTGLLTGLISTLVTYPLFITWHDAYLRGRMTGSTLYIWVTAAVTVILAATGGLLAARRSGSVQPGRCAALGGLAGGLAGTIVFCLWGAAAAGLSISDSLSRYEFSETMYPYAQVGIISAIVRQTLRMFLTLFLGGSGLGAAGGWLVCPRQYSRVDVFDKNAPQMAMNVAITAVPASIFAAAMSAAIFPRLVAGIGGQSGTAVFTGVIMNMPLVVSLLLVLISHFALTLVALHEARQAEHLCGMNEVRMAAWVGIAAAPVLIMLLFLIRADSFFHPLVVVFLLASAGMSLKSLHTLVRLILPRRASFPSPQENWQKTEASLFGSIAKSNGARLAMLCIGCGLVMVLPLYVTVLSVLVNLADVFVDSALAAIPGGVWRLFVAQALISGAGMLVPIAALIAIYLFYLNLGRWFSKHNVRQAG